MQHGTDSPAEPPAEPQSQADGRVELGRIGAPHGVRGWVRVVSDTDPPDNILAYRPWLVGDTEMDPVEGQRSGKALIARLGGCDDRDAAAALVGKPIAVHRRQLPPPRADELYWVDLEGLAVRTLDGVELGRVSHLLPTGANDVLVVQGERERLLPFVWDQVVRDVDFGQGLILVDWDPDF
ncbi:MAG: 16S rRNA processing protein RimM [Gammaproteobacteria bacterium]|nr:16S rRNA processing protein RimM [Gammaproteobacteria bacterium]